MPWRAVIEFDAETEEKGEAEFASEFVGDRNGEFLGDEAVVGFDDDTTWPFDTKPFGDTNAFAVALSKSVAAIIAFIVVIFVVVLIMLFRQ